MKEAETPYCLMFFHLSKRFKNQNGAYHVFKEINKFLRSNI